MHVHNMHTHTSELGHFSRHISTCRKHKEGVTSILKERNNIKEAIISWRVTALTINKYEHLQKEGCDRRYVQI